MMGGDELHRPPVVALSSIASINQPPHPALCYQNMPLKQYILHLKLSASLENANLVEKYIIHGRDEDRLYQ